MNELSPLQEIERRVQARAKEISLEMAAEGGRAKLRALIDDEVRGWSSDFQRGLRAFDLADPDVVAERAFRNLAGYGPLEPLLADDDVWEIPMGTAVMCTFGETAGQSVCGVAAAYSPVCAVVHRLWCRCGAGGESVCQLSVVDIDTKFGFGGGGQGYRPGAERRNVHVPLRKSPTSIGRLDATSDDRYAAPSAGHNANLSPLVEGPLIQLAERHAKVRRDGYRR